MIETVYGHTLWLTLNSTDALILRYNRNQRVRNTIAHNGVLVERKDMCDMVGAIHTYNQRLRWREWYSIPVEGFPQTSGYKNEINWNGNVLIQEIHIGGLIWQIEFDLDSKMYTVEISEFNLSWADYIYFFKSWQSFIEDAEVHC